MKAWASIVIPAEHRKELKTLYTYTVTMPILSFRHCCLQLGRVCIHLLNQDGHIPHAILARPKEEVVQHAAEGSGLIWIGTST